MELHAPLHRAPAMIGNMVLMQCNCVVILICIVSDVFKINMSNIKSGDKAAETIGGEFPALAHKGFNLV